MKYLKSFEGRQKNPIRKYVVVPNNGKYEKDCLIIYKVVVGSKTHRLLMPNFVYVIESEDLINFGRNCRYEDYKILNNGYLFTSDDLDDVIDQLPILADMGRYNL